MDALMTSLDSKFDNFFVDKKVLDKPLIKKILTKLPPHKVQVVDNPPFPETRGTLSKSEFNRSKKNLYFTDFKGQFFKRCPGSRPGLACCNYFVLNLGLQCDMNCSYCYLQSFINSPVMTVYTNIDEALLELESLEKEKPLLPFRIGTGEVVDSLSLDELTEYSRVLISFFKKYPHWKLEFKTKSDKVDQFLDLGPASNTIVSWSINPQYIISAEEHGTASLEDRLDAAKKCLDHGFSIAFHIDPMIWHPDWKDNYGGLVKEITKRFTPSDIPIMSIGALRFQPEQRSIMRERFGFQSLITRAEVFPSHDGKLRYDNSLRQEMYDFVLKKFKEHSSRWNIFFCMENHETWLESSFKSLPKRVEGLSAYFDNTITRGLV